MPSRGAIVGVSDHFGWAAFVTVKAGEILDRRRIELVDKGLPSDPHHHKAQTLPLKQALELIERVRVSAEHRAKLALDEAASAVSARIQGVALRKCPQLPPTVAERIKDYRAQCVADSVMYRNELARAADARDWRVHWYEPKSVFDAAGEALGIDDFETHFIQMKRALGPPWGRDQKLAMAAAIAAARRA
jgi:hypothetical protein